jgi:hypothetical protein
MGSELTCDRFDEADFERFAVRLERSIAALDRILHRPGFGVGRATIGAELELHLTDSQGRPAPVNRAVIADAHDERVTLEMNRYNVELNTRPLPLAGRPFTRMSAELDEALSVTRAAACAHGAAAVMIGILPTLTEADLLSSALSNSARYRALSAGIRRVRGEPATVRIVGTDVLEVKTDDVTFEGANTSFQIHLRVEPMQFARTYNAAQLVTPFVLSLAGNSPIFLGRRLWDETRVALFRQAVEDRCSTHEDDWRPSRVSFGHGWVRESALELFAEAVSQHQPLLPACSDEEDPEEIVRRGGVPRLRELRLHHGTVWRWNRAVYDDADGGHLRIEMRALPAGPTVRDMVANAALAIGLALALREQADSLVTRMTFGQARHSFYGAARAGLGAEILWPCARAPSPRPSSPAELAAELLPLARRGLVAVGVEAEEADAWLGVIEARIARGITGAVWQRRAFDALGGAASALLARYRELSDSGEPVASWPEL